MSICLKKKELADIVGYSYRRLHDIDRNLPENNKLFVEGEEGKYDLTIFVQRWVDFKLAEQAEETYNLEKEKTKHEIIKAEKTQLEVEKMRGQLVDVDDIKKLWGNIANTVMQNMVHLPTKIAPMVLMMDNVERIQAIIDDEIKKVLVNIADTPLPEYAAESSGEESEEV